MNCKKCGAENVDGAKFCCKCGSPLDTPEKNTKINFSDINVEKILSNDKIPKQVKDIINKIMQLPRKGSDWSSSRNCCSDRTDRSCSQSRQDNRSE